MCTDVTDFLLKVTHIRGKRPVDVAVIKFNLDGGRGSQKLMSHMTFPYSEMMQQRQKELSTLNSTAATKIQA